MCGIIGFTGKREAQSILLDGLASLEYRGYDSAGIAYFQRHRKDFTFGKRSGKLLICVRSAMMTTTRRVESATPAGQPMVALPMPMHIRISVGKVALIHNGIIENYHELAGNSIDLEGSARSPRRILKLPLH